MKSLIPETLSKLLSVNSSTVLPKILPQDANEPAVYTFPSFPKATKTLGVISIFVILNVSPLFTISVDKSDTQIGEFTFSLSPVAS